MVSREKFIELLNEGYSLDMVYMLNNEEHIGYLCKNSAKANNIRLSLIRKGLITQDNHITSMGNSILEFCSGEKHEIRKKQVVKEDDFERWWKKYPPTDTFEINGKKFVGSRALRVKKEDCRQKFNAIISSGEYTVDEMIEALELEVKQKAESSYKTGQNKMSYMQNSLTYLNQATYDAFVQLIRQGFSTDNKVKEVEI